MIKKVSGGFKVLSEDGKKNLGGPYKTKAAARLIPCTFIGKHLRFSGDDIAEIMKAGARQPVTSRERRAGHRTT